MTSQRCNNWWRIGAILIILSAMFIFLCLLLFCAVNIAFDYSYKRADDNFCIYNTLYAVILNLLFSC